MDEEKLQRVMGQVRGLVAERIEQAVSRKIGEKAVQVLDIPLIRQCDSDPEPLEQYLSGDLRIDRPHGCAVRVRWADRNVYIERHSSSLACNIYCYVPGEEWETALDDALEAAYTQALLQYVALQWGLDPQSALWDPESATPLI